MHTLSKSSRSPEVHAAHMALFSLNPTRCPPRAAASRGATYREIQEIICHRFGRRRVSILNHRLGDRVRPARLIFCRRKITLHLQQFNLLQQIQCTMQCLVLGRTVFEYYRGAHHCLVQSFIWIAVPLLTSISLLESCLIHSATRSNRTNKILHAETGEVPGRSMSQR